MDEAQRAFVFADRCVFGRSQLFDRQISSNLTGAEASPVSEK